MYASSTYSLRLILIQDLSPSSVTSSILFRRPLSPNDLVDPVSQATPKTSTKDTVMCTEGCLNTTFKRMPDLVRHVRTQHRCEHEDCEGKDQKFRDLNEKMNHDLEQ
jgi:hypothetical protein